MAVLAALLSLLAVQTEAEGVERVSRMSAFASDVQTATGASDGPSAVLAVRSNAQLIGQIETLTGKKGQEALNLLTTWKTQAEQSGQLATQVATLQADKTNSERDTLIAELSTDKPGKPAKLPPALHAWAKTQSKESLEAWAAAAPAYSGAPSPATTAGTQPVTAPNGTTPSVLTAEELEVCKQTGTDPKAFLERKQFEANNQTNPFAVNTMASAVAAS